MTPERERVLTELARMIVAVPAWPARVAIDGPDAAGKTTLADELVPFVAASGRPVLRASIDGFHRPRSERLARGSTSPDGYYLDSFDYAALRSVLLEPLGRGGDRRCRTAVFDYRADVPSEAGEIVVPDEAVLLFDGVFLQRPELADCWDFRIFVSVPFHETLRRARIRDRATMGAAVRERYIARYIPGQKRYLRSVHPDALADVVIENVDPATPRLKLKRAAHARSGIAGGTSTPRP